jgi:hypothetical protein
MKHSLLNPELDICRSLIDLGAPMSSKKCAKNSTHWVAIDFDIRVPGFPPELPVGYCDEHFVSALNFIELEYKVKYRIISKEEAEVMEVMTQ